MVPFAGWELPVQYEGVIAEHRAVREDCGAFDVSHMGELEVEGPRAKELLQRLLSNDLDKIEAGQAQYTLLTNDSGGIVDDLIVYRLEDHRFLLVVNAANTAAAYAWIKDREMGGTDVRDVSDEYGLIAVQGPRSIERLELPEAPAFTFAEAELAGIPCMANRTGYTGELGVELLVMADDAAALWDHVARQRSDAVRARRAGHAAARGLLPVARLGHRREHGCHLGRPGVDMRARQGLQRRGDAPDDQGGRPGGATGSVRHGRARGTEGGHGHRRGRTRHVGHALADARLRHRHGVRTDLDREPG